MNKKISGYSESKRSSEFSMMIIAVAVIALVALVVVMAIFGKFSGEAAGSIGGCGAKGGICADDSQLKGECRGKYPIPIFVSGDCENTKPKNLCCLDISE